MLIDGFLADPTRTWLARCGKRPPAAFSHRSAAQRTEAYVSPLRSLRPCWTAFLRILHGCSASSQATISVTATEIRMVFPHLARETGVRVNSTTIVGQEIRPLLPAKRLKSVQNRRGNRCNTAGPSSKIERRTFTFLRRVLMLIFSMRMRRFVFSRFLPTDTVSLDRGGRRAVRHRRKCAGFQLFSEMNEDLLLRGNQGGELLNV